MQIMIRWLLVNVIFFSLFVRAMNFSTAAIPEFVLEFEEFIEHIKDDNVEEVKRMLGKNIYLLTQMGDDGKYPIHYAYSTKSSKTIDLLFTVFPSVRYHKTRGK